MQIYTQGVNPLFWKQVAQLPDGLQNKDPNQAPALPIPMLLVDFVDYPVGTILDLYVNSIGRGQVKVVDGSGFVYSDVVLPHTHNQDSLEIQLRIGSLIVSASSFSTSNIAMIFEVGARALSQAWQDAEQLREDVTIGGVEASLLEGKFGTFTGLLRRNDQSLVAYRNQTACLWASFQYAGTVKGLIDSLICLLGDISITLDYTRDDIANRIFDKNQYVPDSDGAAGDPFTANAGRWDPTNKYAKRYDADTPHYYVAEMPANYRDNFFVAPEYPVGGSPLDILLAGATDWTGEWTDAHVQSLTIRTIQAIGNEVFVIINEANALVSVTETITRRDGTLIDNLSNQDVVRDLADTTGVVIPGYTQGTDFTIDALAGTVTWIGSAPTAGATYQATYQFRLDDEIRIVARQVKPVQRSVVILFSNRTSTLPKAIKA